jgi:hypothetical protein
MKCKIKWQIRIANNQRHIGLIISLYSYREAGITVIDALTGLVFSTN